MLSVVPQMRRVVAALGHSIPGMASVVAVLCLLFYVSAVLTTKLFGTHPDPRMQEWFGTIGDSAYTLFQIMTLESWSMGIVRPNNGIFPTGMVCFSYHLLLLLALQCLIFFIGIIVDAMQVMHELPAQSSSDSISKDEFALMMQKLETLQKDINQINVQINNK